MKKILVLGSTGMAGHMIYYHLAGRTDYSLTDVSFRKKLHQGSLLVDVTDRDSLVKTLRNIKPQVVINCIGALIKGASADPANAIYLNSFLPHLLSSLAAEEGFSLIHLSTDCVFSGLKGDYLPSDPRDAQDLYGMSKALGEVSGKNILTVRTSIIGPELKNNGEGLLHWFLTQTGSINGYTESVWTGVTTLQLARGVEKFIDSGLTGLIHYTNGVKISKYDLLVLMAEFWNRHVELMPVPGKKADKSLIPTHPEITAGIPDYESMCRELSLYMAGNPSVYGQYGMKIPAGLSDENENDQPTQR
jgi:dTDP-4-dehydrorhamnose reductase